MSADTRCTSVGPLGHHCTRDTHTDPRDEAVTRTADCTHKHAEWRDR